LGGSATTSVTTVCEAGRVLITIVALGRGGGITTTLCILLNISGIRIDEAEGLAKGIRWLGNAWGILPLL
jgi:hypothetical protein